MFVKKAELMQLMDIIKSNAISYEEWKESLSKLKEMLADLKNT